MEWKRQEILQNYLNRDSFAPWVSGEEVKTKGAPKMLRKAGSETQWKQLVQGDSRTVEQATEAAQKQFLKWSATPPPERGKILRTVADLLLENKDILAETMAHEMGKPITQGRGEVDYSAGFFSWFAGEAERIYGKTVPSQRSEQRILLIQQPIGVCALIAPWNFPLAMPARKVAAALAAGCTMVVKPSSSSVLSSLLLVQLLEQAGVPPGVVNVVFGEGDEIGFSLCRSPIIRKLSFTGSVSVGKKLYAQCAGTLKKLTLELGGNAPTIVYEDADLDKAVQATVDGKFRNNGQTCVCPNRIYVQSSVYNAFAERFIEAVRQLKVGDALDPETDVSTFLMPSSIEKVNAHVKDAVEKGAELHSCGDETHCPKVLKHVNDTMRIYQEETFGPVAAITSFETDQEVIEKANDSQYGLASYVFTQSLERAQHTAENLEYGIVGLNDGIPSNPRASFGGVKESGFGREGGPHGLQEYQMEKYISLVT